MRSIDETGEDIGQSGDHENVGEGDPLADEEGLVEQNSINGCKASQNDVEQSLESLQEI